MMITKLFENKWLKISYQYNKPVDFVVPFGCYAAFGCHENPGFLGNHSVAPGNRFVAGN